MKILGRTIYALLIALDLLGSALSFGAPFQTISARLAKGKAHGSRAATIAADALDRIVLAIFGEPCHCEVSLAAYVAREAAASSWSG